LVGNYDSFEPSIFMMTSKKTKKKHKKKIQYPVGQLIKVRQAVAQIGRLPKNYPQFLSQLKDEISKARIHASLAANSEMIQLYWRIGRGILSRQDREGWGAKVIDRLAVDLRSAFPDMKGFSPRNLKYMRALAEAYPREPFVQQAVAQIPWGHNVRILDHVKTHEERQWYIHQTIAHGWSRDILVMQIERRLYERKGKAVTNFKRTLPEAQSDLAHQVLKDPYLFDFLSVGDEAQERDIEKGLVHHITKFLLELGAGFSFVGQQYHLEVGEEDFYIDLLFYHLKLRCYVVVELKTGKFEPKFAGQLNFYLSAIDDRLRDPSDNPTIGLLLCKNKNKLIAEYALKDVSKPIGVSEYKIMKSIPAKLKTSLPTIEELEKHMPTTCETCGLLYVPGEPGENRAHSTRHRRWVSATNFLKYSPIHHREREDIKREAHSILQSNVSLEKRIQGATMVLRTWFDRSLEAAIIGGYWKKHPKFDNYVAMMLSHENLPFSEDVLKHLKNKFGTNPGQIPDGKSYWETTR